MIETRGLKNVAIFIQKMYMQYKLGQACYAALFHYKLEETLLQIGAASLLQIRASVENWGSYYKLGQPLLQNGAAIANWGKRYYKQGQVLQIRAIITNQGITWAESFILFQELREVRQLDSLMDLLYCPSDGQVLQEFLTILILYLCLKYTGNEKVMIQINTTRYEFKQL